MPLNQTKQNSWFIFNRVNIVFFFKKLRKDHFLTWNKKDWRNIFVDEQSLKLGIHHYTIYFV